ncbi:MAG: alkaline phosphatase family protein [Coriobacteriia bacterium]
MGRLTRMLVWVAGLAAVVVCLGSAYVSYTLAGYSWDQVVSYRSPYVDEQPRLPQVNGQAPASDATGTSAAPAARDAAAARPRVVLVICDGLTLRASRAMNRLELLRQHGTDMVATTPQPSLSYPTWTTILSGAPPDISGVSTNWFEGGVPVETLLDTALIAGRRVAVSAPADFDTLYLENTQAATYYDEWREEYMTATYVDEALRLVGEHEPDLLLVHLPDADEAAHDHGADSPEYAEVTQRMDGDIARLVEGLQDDRTVFVVCADHGHIPPGGHGGWERDVTEVPAVFVGPGTSLGSGTMTQTDIAPTVAALLGIPVPAHATGHVNTEILMDHETEIHAAEVRYKRFARRYLKELGVSSDDLDPAVTYGEIDAVLEAGRTVRLAQDRSERLSTALGIAGAAVLTIALVFAMSWRAGVAALTGTATYYAAYNALFFGLHGYHWSLSAFNAEEYIQAFFYGRMAEAALAAVIGLAVAALVYPLLRAEPKGPRGRFLAGWLSLGPAVVITILATLWLQVAWFLWAWGAQVVWRLPDLKWGFKYDLDLMQATAVGAVAVLSPLVTYVVGRYHPRVRAASAEES